MKTYNKYESSVLESLDYDYASEIYAVSHPWHDLRNLLIRELENKYDTEIVNIKFEIKTGFFNLGVYFKDQNNLNKIPTSEFRRFSKDQELLDIVETSIKLTSPEALKDLKLNPNGVQLNNYQQVCIAKAISDAQFEIRKRLLRNRRFISAVLIFNGIIIIMIQDTAHIENFLKRNRSKRVKRRIYKITKKYDKHNVIFEQTLDVRIDNYETYQSIGGYNYYRSDYFVNAIKI